MQLAIPFPSIDPEIFSIHLMGIELALRWYAMAYIAGILIGWRLALAALHRPRLWPDEQPPMSAAQLDDFLTWLILGILLGGRLGFVLFYQPAYYAAHPAEIPMLWQGGMSFHGGLIGVIAAAWIFTARHALPRASVADLLAIGTPPGLLLGRIANFINAELWGAPTTLPWGVIFPGSRAQDCPGIRGVLRTPSEPALRSRAGGPRAWRSAGLGGLAARLAEGAGAGVRPFHRWLRRRAVRGGVRASIGSPIRDGRQSGGTHRASGRSGSQHGSAFVAAHDRIRTLADPSVAAEPSPAHGMTPLARKIARSHRRDRTDHRGGLHGRVPA